MWSHNSLTLSLGSHKKPGHALSFVRIIQLSLKSLSLTTAVWKKEMDSGRKLAANSAVVCDHTLTHTHTYWTDRRLWRFSLFKRPHAIQAEPTSSYSVECDYDIKTDDFLMIQCFFYLFSYSYIYIYIKHWYIYCIYREIYVRFKQYDTNEMQWLNFIHKSKKSLRNLTQNVNTKYSKRKKNSMATVYTIFFLLHFFELYMYVSLYRLTANVIYIKNTRVMAMCEIPESADGLFQRAAVVKLVKTWKLSSIPSESAALHTCRHPASTARFHGNVQLRKRPSVLRHLLWLLRFPT